MHALVVGYGSIGQRHVKNLLKIKTIEKIAVCTKNISCENAFKNNKKVEIVSSLKNINADFAIIANETYKHVDTALHLAGKGIHLLVEKPLSHNLKKTFLLKKEVARKKLKLCVAYNMRFLGAIRYIKEQLAKNVLGDIYFAQIEAGQYLPLWREKDYTESYSAHKSKGGGVALDLSHEIDYMHYLFGNPCSWKTFKAKVSRLKIDSNDMFEAIYKYENNFMCSVHLDYLQSEKKRFIRIVGSGGTLICDFIKKYIKIKNDAKETITSDESMFDFDKTYSDELNHFIGTIQGKTAPSATVEDGIMALKLLEDKGVQR